LQPEHKEKGVLLAVMLSKLKISLDGFDTLFVEGLSTAIEGAAQLTAP